MRRLLVLRDREGWVIVFTLHTKQGTRAIWESLGEVGPALWTAIFPGTERLSCRNIFHGHCEQLGSIRFSLAPG
jgi:hypothetical protein